MQTENFTGWRSSIYLVTLVEEWAEDKIRQDYMRMRDCAKMAHFY